MFYPQIFRDLLRNDLIVVQWDLGRVRCSSVAPMTPVSISGSFRLVKREKKRVSLAPLERVNLENFRLLATLGAVTESFALKAGGIHIMLEFNARFLESLRLV